MGTSTSSAPNALNIQPAWDDRLLTIDTKSISAVELIKPTATRLGISCCLGYPEEARLTQLVRPPELNSLQSLAGEEFRG